jgi:hypothetical protein
MSKRELTRTHPDRRKIEIDVRIVRASRQPDESEGKQRDDGQCRRFYRGELLEKEADVSEIIPVDERYGQRAGESECQRDERGQGKRASVGVQGSGGRDLTISSAIERLTPNRFMIPSTDSESTLAGSR